MVDHRAWRLISHALANCPQTEATAMPGTEPPAAEYREGAALLRTGAGFFRPESRPARDLGVLLALDLANRGPLRVLDAMAGCGIRSLRYGLEAGACQLWTNDADPDRLPWLRQNLAQLPASLAWQCSSRTAQGLLASCLERRQRFELVDLDAFGCPSALVPLALEAVAHGGVLYLNSSDGRSPTGHDRAAAVRRLGAAARSHPAPWELALRLQLGVLARAAWAQGRGLTPVLSFSDGRTFRTAVRLERRPQAREEAHLGLLAHCHRCGEQWGQSLLRLDRWRECGCGPSTPLAVSGPLWIGPLQHQGTLERLRQLAEAAGPGWIEPASMRLLDRLALDAGLPVRCWSMAELARQLGQGPPARAALLRRLRQEGFDAHASAVMPAQLRSDAPWARILELARDVISEGGASPVDPVGAASNPSSAEEGQPCDVPTADGPGPRVPNPDDARGGETVVDSALASAARPGEA
jgi:tRNA (guanine26-N2/guanine27-N2)-dimethyltransferase